MATTDSESGKGPTAPYISFQTLKTVSKDMKEHQVPSRIDRSVFRNLSGGVVGQLLPALKFLRLTDDEGTPTTDLKTLVEAYDTDKWSPTLGKILRTAYVPIIALNLETATPSQFDEVFRRTYAGTDEVGRKSKTFFLTAAQEAGIKISPYILKGRKSATRGPTIKRRVTRQHGANPVLPNEPTPANAAPKTASETLLGYLDAEMGDAEKNAIWTLLQYFKAKGQ